MCRWRRRFYVDIEDTEAIRMQSINDCVAVFHKYKLAKFNRNKLAGLKEEKEIVSVEK